MRGQSEKGDNKMKKPRLTDSDRLAIETGLKSGKTVYMIAKELSRPVTTVTREIKARAVESDKGAAYRVTNRCAFRMECQRRDICAACMDCPLSVRSLSVLSHRSSSPSVMFAPVRDSERTVS